MGSIGTGLAMVAAGIVAGAAASAAATSPAPLWSGANRLILSCSADAAAAAALGGGWCAMVLAEARRGAAMPVSVSARPVSDRAALTLHVAARDGEIGVLIARAVSVDDAEGAFVRHGPALPPGAAADPRVRAAVAHALDGALPWRRARAASGWRSRRAIM